MGKRFDLASLAKEAPFQPPAFQNGESGQSVDDSDYRKVPTSTVTTNPLNQRPAGEDEDIEQLTKTLREYGTIQPMLVCSVAAFLARFPDHRAVLAEAEWVALIGNRRLLASRRAQLDYVDVLINNDRVSSMYKAMLIENGQRREMPPLHEAQAMAKAMEEESLSQRDLARQIGKSDGFVSQRLALLKLIPELKTALEAKELPLELARTVGELPVEQQQEIAQAGKPYRLPGFYAVKPRRRSWSTSPTSAASAIQKKFKPDELAELVQLLTDHLNSLSR
jgi:ParB family transcriptional regulator, chromosome partitioning protein